MSLFPQISSDLASSWYPSRQAYVNDKSSIPAQYAVCNERTTIVRSAQQAGHKRNTLAHWT